MGFIYEYGLKYHTRNQHAIKETCVCDLCGMEINVENIKRHMKNKHSSDETSKLG